MKLGDGFLLRVAVTLGGIVLLALTDVVVLEGIYKPTAARYGIRWSEFEVAIPFLGTEIRVLRWHLAFVPLGFGLFVLCGVAGRDWRLALAGAILFATGWEDIAYYVLQLQLPPSELPWLDAQPGVAWTRLLLGEAHLSRLGLCLAALLGGTVSLRLLCSRPASAKRRSPPATAG